MHQNSEISQFKPEEKLTSLPIGPGVSLTVSLLKHICHLHTLRSNPLATAGPSLPSRPLVALLAKLGGVKGHDEILGIQAQIPRFWLPEDTWSAL